ncbi:cupin-like domain-containing protein [Nannocystis bainbridge]|uniref:Cupin-like domain-containing protein n=1 Tax=Nannocystis bainbridge TaxID=2995303 RepID=A0ABT5E873_9BACT|nr:cupin-like domain-containing protein [Nannocystis bainbridge]MDC0722062.1 cupin-like domain-containing protein [Nannocystis bainbridge]
MSLRSVKMSARRGRATLAPAFRAWLVENLLRGADEAAIRAALAERGVPAATIAGALARARGSAELAGARAVAAGLRREALVNRLRRTLRAAAPQIERRPAPSPSEFLRNYWATGTPVILNDVVPRWPAFSRWSPADLRARFGAAEIEMSIGRAGDDDPDVRFKQHVRRTTLGDYVDRVLAAGETNDLYLIANNRNLARPGLAGLLADIVLPAGYFDEARSASCGALWFGPAGTVTSLHHDTSNILFFQVVGRKRFRLYAPDEPQLLAAARGVYSTLDPEAAGSALAECGLDLVLLPGEALFLPVGWWHHVRALDVSISVAFNNFVWPNQFEWFKPGAPG